MSSGNTFTAADLLSQIGSGISKTDLEAELTASGWTQTPEESQESGSGWIWTSPDSKCSIRVMTRPDASSYARVYNGLGGGSPGEQALNLASQPGTGSDTHFLLPP